MTFFNPAVFHAAGENKTTNDRFANLLQIGSAFGRVIEIVDRKAICEQVYPALLNAKKSGSLTNTEIEHVIAAAGEGYSFPCNLDLTPPVGGLAPASQQDILREALANNHTAEQLCASLNKWQSHQHS
jgi:ectoine hydroxylase-related dioxygenase (phytanoyl-CoA dioxygenase family)